MKNILSWGLFLGLSNVLFAAELQNQAIQSTIQDGGWISTLRFSNANHPNIPFRQDKWRGPAWYIKSKKGTETPIPLTPLKEMPNCYAGTVDSLRFMLSYTLLPESLAVKCEIENQSKDIFEPESAGIRLGFDSYQASYPSWNEKLVPNVMRCEPTHHWGFAMSPNGTLLGWVTDGPTASFNINYEPRQHRIFTANINFLNAGPLPARHPQTMSSLAPGETLTRTIYFVTANDETQIKKVLSNISGAPFFDADLYTVPSEKMTRLFITGHKLRTMTVTGESGKPHLLTPEQMTDSGTVFAFSSRQCGLFTFRAENEKNKICEGSIYVRPPWSWYLQNARKEGLRVKPTETHHAECVYPFHSYFLAQKHFPDSLFDTECESTFQHYFPLHFNTDKKQLRTTYRIQDTAVWAGILADRYAVTGNKQDLEHAADLVDFLIDQTQGKDGAFYAPHAKKTHYTCVIYLAKSMMEVLTEEENAVRKDPSWQPRIIKHREAVRRAIDDLERRRDNIETEGQMTYEDGMISCAMAQLAMYALKFQPLPDSQKYIAAAAEHERGHRSLTLSTHPDARVNGSTIRFWETQYTVCMMANMYNSPCGWTAWKLYADYYLYLLTGNERLLREMFNGLGACAQLTDGNSGRLRWGFTPDPYIRTRWAVPAENPDSTHEHDWKNGVIGEQYIEQISDWNRTQKIWREKWGIDNFVHEIFKCMEETVLNNAFVIERDDGSFVGYNCRTGFSNGSLIIIPGESTVTRIHLNLKNPHRVRAEIDSVRINDVYNGMVWIGPGGIPPDIRPSSP